MTRFPPVQFSLPGWVDEAWDGRPLDDLDAQAAFAVELARSNVRSGTGGPFGAAVIDLDTGLLVAPGVNLVVPSSMAIAHAEIVAISVAGAGSGDHDLGAHGRRCVLVASTEPCAMCFGAVPWSGVVQLVCCARDEDARAVGFDEGPKLSQWWRSLEERGIEVVRDVRRAEAAEVLVEYAAAGGAIYNGRQER